MTFFIPKINLNYYQENMELVFNHWVNGTSYDSGSLLNLWELADLNKHDRETFQRKWNDRFICLNSTQSESASVDLKEFQYLMSNLINKNQKTDLDIDLRHVRYITGGSDFVEINFEKYDISDWGKAHNTGYPLSFENAKEIVHSDIFKSEFACARSLSWHLGLTACIGNMNHRTGYIAAVLDLYPNEHLTHRIKLLEEYFVNHKILEQLLSKYSVYIALNNFNDLNKDKNMNEKSFIFDDLQNSFTDHSAYYADLNKFSKNGFNSVIFGKFEIRIYFLKKTFKNWILRKHLDKQMHNNDLIRQILSDKLLNFF